MNDATTSGRIREPENLFMTIVSPGEFASMHGIANARAYTYSIAMLRPAITHEFYRKLCTVALLFSAACVTTRPAGPEVTTVYLVRDGEKSAADANDPNPTLTAGGRARAEALAAKLRSAGVTHIISTQWTRTRETAEPLASQLGLTTEIVPTTDSDFANRTAAAVLRHRGATILVVGHSNTIASVIAALGGPQLPDLCDSEHSNLFVMKITKSPGPSLVREHYGATDPAPDSACLKRMGG
jgi:broad specificity phosphatase PhoE